MRGSLLTWRLWAWLAGYLVVKIVGPVPEQLLNRLGAVGCVVWGIERMTAAVVLVRLQAKDFRRLRLARQGLPLAVASVDRRGLPFVLVRMRSRAWFLVGGAVVLTAFIWLSGSIWLIEITGSEILPVEAIQQVLDEEGIRRGVSRRGLDLQAVAERLRREVPTLAWVNLSLEGIRLRVMVTERFDMGKDYAGPGSLVAKQDGIVVDVSVAQGLARVRPGDTVREGDLLIEGLGWSDGQYGPLRAEGLVVCRTWFEGYGSARYVEPVMTPTGQTHTGYRLRVDRFDWGFRLDPPFAYYAVEPELIPLGQGPLTLLRYVFSEQQVEYRILDPEEARAEALAEAWRDLADQGIDKKRVAEIYTEDYTIGSGAGVRVRVVVELEQDIAAFVPASESKRTEGE